MHTLLCNIEAVNRGRPFILRTALYDCHRASTGTRPYLHREHRGATISTKEAFEHVIACLKKGCLHSYSGVEGYTTDKIHPVTKLPQFYCLQGTSKNEAFHR